MNKINAILLSAIVFLSPSIQAKEKEHKIDRWLSQQLEKDLTTYEMLNSIYKGSKMWDKEMNISYKYLMKHLNAEQKKNLKKAQRAWIVFRDAENTSRESILEDRRKFGTLGLVESASNYYEMIKGRAQTLGYYKHLLAQNAE